MGRSPFDHRPYEPVFHQQYNGGEEVQVADGSNLPITHTGSALLPTSSRAINLKDVLYVPDVTKNIILVYRLCNSNQVSVEFFPAHFQVKDLNTGVRLLQGRTRNEQYEWPVQAPRSLLSWLLIGHGCYPLLAMVYIGFQSLLYGAIWRLFESFAGNIERVDY